MGEDVQELEWRSEKRDDRTILNSPELRPNELLYFMLRPRGGTASCCIVNISTTKIASPLSTPHFVQNKVVMAGRLTGPGVAITIVLTKHVQKSAPECARDPPTLDAKFSSKMPIAIIDQ